MLTGEGKKQALLLADVLDSFPIDRIISSPYTRAYDTITPLANRIAVPVEMHHDLQERVLSQDNLPDWLDKLKLTFDDLDLSYKGGESSLEAIKRGIAVVHEALDSHAKHIVLVSHGNLIALLLKYYDEQIQFEHWQALTNPDVYELVFDDNCQLIRIERIWQ